MTACRRRRFCLTEERPASLFYLLSDSIDPLFCPSMHYMQHCIPPEPPSASASPSLGTLASLSAEPLRTKTLPCKTHLPFCPLAPVAIPPVLRPTSNPSRGAKLREPSEPPSTTARRGPIANPRAYTMATNGITQEMHAPVPGNTPAYRPRAPPGAFHPINAERQGRPHQHGPSPHGPHVDKAAP